MTNSHLVSSGREFQSVNALLKDLSRPQFVFDLIDLDLKTYGCRAFSHRAPTLWNALPDDIRQVELLETFKSKLKTHLFRQFFN